MRRFLLALGLICLAVAGGASAQPYPSRPITLIVPFPAGGITDIIARIVAEGMRQHLGQTVIVENVPGAGGTIGTTKLARATADGYTIGIGQWTSHVGGGAMYNLPSTCARTCSRSRSSRWARCGSSAARRCRRTTSRS